MVVCEHPRSMFKMDAIFDSSLGLIFCITNTKEKEVPWDELITTDGAVWTVDVGFGGGVSHARKSHLGLLIIRGIKMSTSPCLTAAPLLYEYIKNHSVISQFNSGKLQQNHPDTATGFMKVAI